MRRSSSKLITRARSVRNVGKVPFKFKFDLLVETVEKLAAAGDIVVVWERSSSAKKVEATKPARIDRNTRKASFGNERISADVTLFKNQPTERKFQDKVVKLAVRAGSVDGKTLAKIHLNLAEYAEVPSGSKRISAELTNGSILIATIQCQFISMGKSAPGGKTGKSDTTADGSTDEDDLEDDMAESDAAAAATDEAPASFLKNKLKLTRVGSRKSISRHEKRSRDEENADVANVDFANAERLRKENQRLKKQLEETERSHGDGKLAEENKALRNEIRELKSALAREPVYGDVVKELKEAKMALALLHLEKEKMGLELMNLKRMSSKCK